MKLDQKTAIVTGAGRGIGRAIAERFAAEGAAVALVDIDGARAEAAAEQLRAAGATAHAERADVADPDQVGAAFGAILERFGGRLDILVNNAGIPHHRAFLEMPLAEWERVLRVNLTSMFLCGQAAARVMAAAGGGRIINMGSISGQRGSSGRAAYGASKAGLMQLSRVMAVELAPMGIMVNSIAPGPIDTGITKFGPEQDRAYLARIPVQRYGAAAEVAGAAVFLAGDDSAFITGTVVNVDGGFDAAGLIFSYEELTGYKSDVRDASKSD